MNERLTNPVALQPPNTLGLVLYRFTGLTRALVARFHDRAGLGPLDGPTLGVIGVDAHGAVLITGDPIRCVRPQALEAVAQEMRSLESGAEGSDAPAVPFGHFERSESAVPPRLIVERGALDAETLERLACAMREQANGTASPSWPVRFVQPR